MSMTSLGSILTPCVLIILVVFRILVKEGNLRVCLSAFQFTNKNNQQSYGEKVIDLSFSTFTVGIWVEHQFDSSAMNIFDLFIMSFRKPPWVVVVHGKIIDLRDMSACINSNN